MEDEDIYKIVRSIKSYYHGGIGCPQLVHLENKILIMLNLREMSL